LVGEKIALITILEHDENEIGGVECGILMHYVFVVKFLHDVDFLLDVFL